LLHNDTVLTEMLRLVSEHLNSCSSGGGGSAGSGTGKRESSARVIDELRSYIAYFSCPSWVPWREEERKLSSIVR
jgi:hypothetical protein